MVKVTGGGRGMKAIAAHLRYISKNGRLEIEDQQGSGRHKCGEPLYEPPRVGRRRGWPTTDPPPAHWPRH
jgi:hypothetical protein